MKYKLLYIEKGNKNEIDISETEYNQYINAKNILSSCLRVETAYEILIANYIELENKILNSTTSYMVHRNFSYSDSFQIYIDLNIKLVNLLSSARLYIDQLPHYASECSSENDIKKIIKTFFNNTYDDNHDYKLMEALRNYAQHRGLPVQWTGPGSRLTTSNTENTDDDHEYYLSFGLLKSDLESDKKFKKEVLVYFEEKIDLRSTIRSYIESLSKIHTNTRKTINESVDHSRQLIKDAHRKFINEEIKEFSVSACKVSDKGELIDRVYLMLNWDDIRLKLTERNIELINFKKRFVSNQS